MRPKKKMNECIFCKIINKEIPSNIIYEDDKTLAFLDNHPVNNGHTIVISKKHFENILDLEKSYLNACFETVQKISKAVKEGVNAEGFNILMNNLKASGQVIFHTHIHIIPRFENDGLKLWGGKDYNPGENLKILNSIKSKIQ